MKKFFSLLCATLLVFSASAAPVAKKAEIAKKAVAVEQMQKVQFEKAQIANFDQLSATPALKVNNFKPQALAKVSQATQAEPIVVIIDGTPSIQPAGDVQAITVIGKDNMVYAWGVKTTSLEAGKTYAFTDMSTDYTYRCSQDYFTTYEDPTDATFSIDAEKNITASMVTESGTYMVYTKAPQPEPVLELAEKYTANGSKYDGTSKTWIPQQSWTLKTGADEEGNYLNGILPALAGTYPVSYTVEDDSVLVIQPGFVDYQSGVLVSIENASAEDGCIRFIAGKDKSLKLKNSTDVIMYGAYDPSTYNFLGTFGQYTSLTYTEQAPITERDTVDVISNKMIYNDFIASNAAVQYYAGADAGYTQFCVTSKNATSVFGTFDVWADYSWINFTETTGTDIQEGQITVTEAEDGVHLTGYVIGDDEKYYRLNWFMAAGVLPSDTDAPFEYEFAWENMQSVVKEGIVDIIAADGICQMRLVLFVNSAATTIPAGTYVISDTQEAGTALKSVGYNNGAKPCYAATLVEDGGQLYLDDMWFMVEGAVTIAEDGSIAVNAKNSYGQDVIINIQAPTPTVTDYYLVGWINGAAYGIEGDIDNFGDYHFVDGKVKATFNELSYVQVKDNNKQIYGTDSYKAPVNVGNALLFKTGTEKIAINGGAEYEYTLTVYEDGTLEILYEEVTTDLRNAKANVKAAKQIKNGQIVIVRENKEYNILGTAL